MKDQIILYIVRIITLYRIHPSSTQRKRENTSLSNPSSFRSPKLLATSFAIGPLPILIIYAVSGKKKIHYRKSWLPVDPPKRKKGFAIPSPVQVVQLYCCHKNWMVVSFPLHATA